MTEITAEQLAYDIEVWSRDNVVGKAWNFQELLSHVESYASTHFGQSLSLVNPRMVGTAFKADGFLLHRPITVVHISGSLRIPDERE